MALLLGVCVVAPGASVEAAEWDWMLAPYLWGAGVGLDVEVNNDAVFGGDVSFSDLLDKTEIAGMIHFEGRTGKAGFFVDAVYLSLADSGTTPAAPPLLPDGATFDSEIKMGKYEAVGFYRPKGGEYGFDVLLGVRAIDFDQQVEITRTTPTPATRTLDSSEMLLDGFVGARFARPFADRWWFQVRGDAGTGDTELSWSAVAGVGVWFGESRKYGLDLAYEHFAFEVEEQNGVVTVETESQFSGPIVGFIFRF